MKKVIFKKLNINVEAFAKVLLEMYVEECSNKNSTVDNINAVAERCLRIARWASDGDCKPSLMICGGVGTGKSTMLKALWRTLGRTIYPYLINAIDLPTKVNDDPSFLQKVMREKYLLIDDVGEEPTQIKIYGSSEILMPRIISYRYDNNLPTIITTNLSTKDTTTESTFLSSYGVRVSDRVKEMFNKIVIDGESHRKK